MSVNADFWGEVAPCEHIVQIYEGEQVFLDTLEGFVNGGLAAGEGVVVIATASHLRALEDRLTAKGTDIAAARARDQYISLNAHETLAAFLVNDWPDEDLFTRHIMEILARARGNGRRVRAFGEMVALLWARGQNGATVRLEHLWDTLCQTEGFSLFCAYPKIGFTQDMSTSIHEICTAHSRVIDGSTRSA